MRANILGIAVALVLAAAAHPAVAQEEPQERVNSLLDQARQAYEQNLDIVTAQDLVDQALAVVVEYRGAGPLAANAYAMRGVIHVWLGENDKALEMFRRALAEDPDLQLPEAWSGPDVERALRAAGEPAGANIRRRLRLRTAGTSPTTPPPPLPAAGGPDPDDAPQPGARRL